MKQDSEVPVPPPIIGATTDESLKGIDTERQLLYAQEAVDEEDIDGEAVDVVVNEASSNQRHSMQEGISY